jgi:hypothetical protein
MSTWHLESLYNGCNAQKIKRHHTQAFVSVAEMAVNIHAAALQHNGTTIQAAGSSVLLSQGVLANALSGWSYWQVFGTLIMALAVYDQRMSTLIICAG